ncbi:MAG: ABC transporter permease [Pseudobdellovibrionaceae bacterium]
MRRFLLPFLPLVMLVTVLELICKMGWVPFYILPPPSEVLNSLLANKTEIAMAAVDTFLTAFAGLFLSFIIGNLIAGLLTLSPKLRAAFLPYALFFQTVPIIAIAPVLVIWFGFGYPTVIASAFICSLFPIIASTLLGLLSTDKNLVDLLKFYKASPVQAFLKLKLPSALPQIFSGLKIAAGLAVIGAVVGEFIGGGGLGSVVDAARTQQKLDKVFAAVLVSSFIGLLFFVLVNWLAWIFLHRWHASESERLK